MSKLIARSLRDVAMARASDVEALLLSRSPDLICKNVMCEKLGDACICKLSQVLSRLPDLVVLDISYNNLQSIPQSIFTLKKLRCLNLKGNRITSIPNDVSSLVSLEEIDLSGNMLNEDARSALQKLSFLRSLRLSENDPAIAIDNHINSSI